MDGELFPLLGQWVTFIQRNFASAWLSLEYLFLELLYN